MKRLFALICTIALLLTACTTGGDNTSSAVESSEPEIEEELSLDVDLFKEDEELSGTLVISSDSASTYSAANFGIYPLVEGFNELHPNVEIKVEGFNVRDSDASDEETAVLKEQYKQELRINLTAGNAPDLMFTYDNYTASFALTDNIMDLNAFMQNDPTFLTEDYFTQIFEAAEVNGKLYNMPNVVMFTLMRIREDVLAVAGVNPDSLKTIDYKTLLDIYNKAVSSGQFPDLKYIGKQGLEGNALLYLHEITNAFDSNNMTANFNSPEFIEYLTLTKEYPIESTFGAFDSPVYDFNETFINNTYFAEVTSNMMVFFDTDKFIIETPAGATNLIPVVTSGGTLPIRSVFNMSIPTNSNNPALAWEFIKYCIYESEEMPQGLEIEKFGRWNGDRFTRNIPVNKNNFRKFAEGQLEDRTQEEKDKFIEIYENALSLPLTITNYDAYLPAYENEILREYYEIDGLYTAEEVAEILQEQTEVYLKEIE